MAPKPKRGDLIEISRGLTYQHWALYVGKGAVIHLVLVSGRANAVSCCLGSVGEDKAIVKREKLKNVVRKDKYCIRNHLDDQYKHRRIKDIVKDANSRVGKRLPYNLRTNNCEHFVTLLRYGTPLSLQAQQVETAAAFSVLVVAAVAFGFIVLARPS